MLAVIGLSLMFILAACAPEGQREFGGDSGGDVGNHGDPVRMHGEDDAMDRMYFEAPFMGLGIERSQEAGEDDEDESDDEES